MTSVFDPSPVPSSIQALLELFETSLTEVKFPDVDRVVLASAAERVTEDAAAVAEAEAALELARQQLQESQDALLHRGARALAYARVYAEENPALLSRLDAIVMPRTQKRARVEIASPEATAPKRRGRPPKALAATHALFQESANAGSREETHADAADAA